MQKLRLTDKYNTVSNDAALKNKKNSPFKAK